MKCGVSGRALELQGIIIADLASLVETGNLFGMETLPTGICRVTLEMVAAGYIFFCVESADNAGGIILRIL